MSASAEPTDRATTAPRMPGVDVARALAVLGMVLVNYKLRIGAEDRGEPWLVWLSDRLDGRAAALFVVLAGVGISLRSRRARADPVRHASFERRALLERAAVLFAAGLLNLHFWDWDILHCYGLFLAVAALLITASDAVLGLVAIGCTAIAPWLQARFDYDTTLDLWSIEGMGADLFFNGLHPFFPWMSFLAIGMWLGRRDLRQARFRRRLIAASVGVVLVGELVDSFTTRAPLWLGLTEEQAELFSSWPKPPGPVYVIVAAAGALAAIALCVAMTEERAEARGVVALAATGQMAFTLYIAHAIAIEIPLFHGLLVQASLAESFAYAGAFYVLAVAGSLWWRRRFAQGPLEALIRQLTGRRSPAPWGDAPLRKGD